MGGMGFLNVVKEEVTTVTKHSLRYDIYYNRNNGLL